MTRACVIGSGPNGLAAAITLARAGIRTTVLEAEPMLGGGTRTAELTLPGFRHDVCSAVHPLAVCSPVFESMPLAQHGLDWIHPPIPVAHAMEDGPAPALFRDLNETAAHLGSDGDRYKRVVAPLVRDWTRLTPMLLAPIRIPAHPLLLAHFGALAAWPATVAARSVFPSERGRALFAGIAAHSILPLESIGSGAFGWVLAIAAHAAGWPIPRGGAQSIADALASYFRSLGGEIVVNARVRRLSEIDADLALFDLSPKPFLEVAGDRLPEGYRWSLEKFRYGPAAFKLDWALSAPIPWKSAVCARAGTVHVGGSMEEVANAERAAANGHEPARPFVLVTQPSLFDPTRAPAGMHVAWAYCHVPNGSTADMTGRVEAQIERFAPGFGATILARRVFTPAEIEAHNANLVGGDIVAGANDPMQILFRPTRHLYRTPLRGVYLCSASTPPGGGVHGMCGFHAARAALRDSCENRS
ncbi:MAG TPA: NAD(P)/FAD-dependent oxidoreductase [Bryobacteraceae bacterium]|nr:NAD(P)/FAD-dependent oxidoreductase [Bryobacteraceae bacterium]